MNLPNDRFCLFSNHDLSISASWDELRRLRLVVLTSESSCFWSVLHAIFIPPSWVLTLFHLSDMPRCIMLFLAPLRNCGVSSLYIRFGIKVGLSTSSLFLKSQHQSLKSFECSAENSLSHACPIAVKKLLSWNRILIVKSEHIPSASNIAETMDRTFLWWVVFAWTSYSVPRQSLRLSVKPILIAFWGVLSDFRNSSM